MNSNCDLCSLERGQSGYIKDIREPCAIKKRLNELGFVEGARVYVLLDGWGKAVRAYEICGATIALRREDAAMIEVRK